MQINGKLIVKPFYIAEIGVNYEGSMDACLEMVKQAKEANADAVKFQAFVPELCSTDQNFVDLLNRVVFKKESEWRIVRDYCAEIDIDFICTVDDQPSLDLMLGLKPDALKIGSGESDWQEHVHKTLITCVDNKIPFILSLGNKGSNEKCIDIINNCENYLTDCGRKSDDISYMYCVSRYPAKEDELNLHNLSYMMCNSCCRLVGYSDHTDDILSVIVAISLGSRIIEKHFNIRETPNCIDASVSIYPDQFKDMVEIGNRVISMFESKKLEVNPEIQKGLYLARDVKAGSFLTKEDLIALRPYNGYDTQWLTSEKEAWNKFAGIKGICYKKDYLKGTSLADIFN